MAITENAVSARDAFGKKAEKNCFYLYLIVSSPSEGARF